MTLVKEIRPHLEGIATTYLEAKPSRLEKEIRPHLEGIATDFIQAHAFSSGGTKEIRPHLEGIATGQALQT